MSRNGVAGGVVAIVRDDSVVHLQGYGMADRESSVAVHPHRTTFGLSSLSKVFTAIAVLRLAEQGRVSLDDAVHDRVPLAALATERGRRVRIAHLLTHSGGFDERTIGISERTTSNIVPLGDYLAAEMPAVIRAPGTVASYSNHGFALAGLLVERVAGEPFAEHVRRHILEPLGMRASGFGQPLPAELERARAIPYRGGGLPPVPRIYFNDAPASALYSTGGDMARFMTAFLGDSSGSLGSVLRSSALVQTRQFSHHPALNGLTYGFRERRDRGVRGLQQGGDWDDYTSDLILAPAERLGLFVALSGDGASVIADSIWSFLLAKHVDDTAEDVSAADTTAAEAFGRGPRRENVVGAYRLNRYSRHTLAKLGVLTGAIREVSVTTRDGRLEMAGQTLSPAGPDLYHRNGGSDVAFRFGADGRATHLFTDGVPYVAYERIRWFESRALHRALLGITFAILLGTLWRAAVRWPLSPARDDRSLAWWRRGMTAAGAGATWLVVGLAATMLVVPLNDFQYGTPSLVQVALAGGFLAVAGAITALGVAVATLARGGLPARVRIGRLALSLVAVLFAVLVYYWRLAPLFA